MDLAILNPSIQEFIQKQIGVSIAKLALQKNPFPEVEWIPTTTVELNEEQAQEVLKLIDKLEQDEDVQKVFHNLK